MEKELYLKTEKIRKQEEKLTNQVRNNNEEGENTKLDNKKLKQGTQTNKNILKKRKN